MSPTGIDLAWAAGFLEGEGCFGWSGGKKGPSSERISAGQKNPEPLYKLLAMFGGRIGMQHQMTKNLIKSQGVATSLPYWMVSGSRARGVMMTLYPLLSKRRQEKIKQCLTQKEDK